MELVLLVVVIVIALATWLFVRSTRRSATDLDAQGRVEHLALALIEQYPSAGDDQIVQLIRDDLLNRRAREPLLFQWANAETVGRVRRTVVRVALGHIPTGTSGPSAPPVIPLVGQHVQVQVSGGWRPGVVVEQGARGQVCVQVPEGTSVRYCWVDADQLRPRDG
jgi:hypothetical protein